jgi:hypothetical protein
VKEEDVYSFIARGHFPEATCLRVIRAYGNRKAMEALEEAKKAIPERMLSANEVEIEMYIKSCIEKLDQMIALTMGMEQETK